MKTFLNNISDVFDKNIVEKMHTKNRAGTDPITKKNEEERLGEI
jgi:hypothetical protein